MSRSARKKRQDDAKNRAKNKRSASAQLTYLDANPWRGKAKKERAKLVAVLAKAKK